MSHEHRRVMIENEPKFLLSICTPTYNRAELFQKSLEILLPQISKYGDKVSMHVSDNASTDNTETMIRELSLKHNVPIDYFKQLENVGLERNYAKAATMSDGRYTFILGDDDLLAPDFLQTILTYIDTNEEYGVIHFNWIHADDNLNAQYVQNKRYITETYMSVKNFFMDVLASPNFTSAVIFNTKLWNIGASVDGEYDGGGYWGYARIIKGACLFDKTCIYLHYPLVIQRNPIRSFDAMMPYYCFVDMSRIYQLNDRYIPGIFAQYKECCTDYCYYELLDSIKYDIPFYKVHRCEMKEFMTEEELDLYDYILNARKPKDAYKKWMLKRKWSRRVQKLWKSIITRSPYYG